MGCPWAGWARRPGTRQFLNALAIGILLFLIWDVLVHAWDPLDSALGGYTTERRHRPSGGVRRAVLPRPDRRHDDPGVLRALAAWPGPAAELRPGHDGARRADYGPGGIASWSTARRLSLLIAVGIGLHNFGEGLAIGGSAATGEIGLAMVLVIGFALHNGTEGFGIVAPLAAEGDRPSWGFLLLMGLIGGGPTFVGTMVGRQFTSEAMSVIFLTLAAGSILYVVIQLLGVAHKNGRKELLYWGVLLGLTAGFVTDMVVTAGGA